MEGGNEGRGWTGRQRGRERIVFFFHGQVVTGDGWSAEQVSANTKSRNLPSPCLCDVLWPTEA